MNRTVVDHGGGEGGPGEPLGFIAELDEEGRKIVINLKSKNQAPVVIKIGKKCSSIDGFLPSVDGRVIWCLLENGKGRFFETATGCPLAKIKGRGAGKRGYRPEFYV